MLGKAHRSFIHIDVLRTGSNTRVSLSRWNPAAHGAWVMSSLSYFRRQRYRDDRVAAHAGNSHASES